MAERNSLLSGNICRSALVSLFTLSAVLFIISWFFVLRSTGQPRLVYNGRIPNSKVLARTNNADENQDADRYESEGSGSSRESGLSIDCDNAVSHCDERVLKVFMYDLPPEFHFGLLGWEQEGSSVWPDIRTKIPGYPGGLNLQHSIEYWLTLDLLSSEISGNAHGGAARRVFNSSEADVIFVPFFSSLSYNRFSKVKSTDKRGNDKLLQDKLVKFLESQEEWKRSGGVGHVIMAHHPNSMSEARNQLWPAMFILSDFGRYPPTIANVMKDVIAPYKHVIKTFSNDTLSFDSRPTLLFFQGAIYRKDGGIVRQELFYLLKDEKDVHFTFGSVQRDGVSKASEGMHSSKFCLNIAGDTPSSNRLFDAIASHCVPVIISDEIELPYEDVLDYSEFCVFVRTSDAVKKDYLLNLVRGIGRDEWTRMWERLKEVEKHFEFRYPSKDDDAVQMIWKAVARKVPAIKFKVHHSRRFSRTTDPAGETEKQFLVPKSFW